MAAFKYNKNENIHKSKAQEYLQIAEKYYRISDHIKIDLPKNHSSFQNSWW